MRGPSNVLSVKNVSDYHLTCKTICGHTVEKNPTNVLFVKNVSDAHLTCKIICGYTVE